MIGDIGEIWGPSGDTGRDILAQHLGGMFGDLYAQNPILRCSGDPEGYCDTMCGSSPPSHRYLKRGICSIWLCNKRNQNMRWNIILVVVSISLLLLFVGVGLTKHLMQAESVAEDLAPLIGVDKYILWDSLENILQRGSVRRTVVNNSPLAILSVLLIIRLISDFVKNEKVKNNREK